MKSLNIDFELTSDIHEDDEVICMCMASDSFRLNGRLTLSLKLCVHVI